MRTLVNGGRYYLIAGAALLAVVAVLGPRQYGSFGTGDFIEYYAAYQLYSADLNLYDRALILAKERPLGWSGDEPLMMFNPPWLLTVMSPVLELSFPRAAQLWLAVNLVLYLGAVYCLAGTMNSGSASALRALVLALLFYPAWSAVSAGQISILLAATFVFAFVALNFRRDTLAGALLVFATFKPHLLYLVWILLGWWLLINRRWRVVAGFCGAMAALAAATFSQSPSALEHWRDQLGSEPWYYTGATLSGWLRMQLPDVWLGFPMWRIAVVLPLLTLVGVLLAGQRLQLRTRLLELIPGLACVSLMTAPFGWLFDQAYALPAAAALGATDENGSRRGTLTLLLFLVLQGAVVLLRAAGVHMHHDFFWYTPVLFLLWLARPKRNVTAAQR